jgi:hypothetical protein
MMSISSLPSLFTNSASQASLPIAMFLDPMAQLSDEFDLEINDLLVAKINGLHNEHDREMVHNHVRTYARQLLLKLQNLRGMGATSQQLRQTGLETLKELETTSVNMMQEFERFQTGSRELEQRFSAFDAKVMAPAPSWAPSVVQRVNRLTNSNLIAPVDPQKTKVHVNAQKIAESPAVYRCFNKKGESTSPVPLSEIPQHEDKYFHATKLDKAIQILTTGEIERKDLGMFKGAFVSSKPESERYGPVVFALNRSIETIPVLNARFDRGPNSHWVGFESSIPVNSDSLEYVAVDLTKFSKDDIPKLKAMLSQAAGREIQVKAVNQVLETIQQRLEHECVCVPEEWPLTFKHINRWWF